MTNDDKEFLLNLLDDLGVFLASLNEKTPAPTDLFYRLARAQGLLEKNYFRLDGEHRHELNFHNDWHSEQDSTADSDD